MLTKINTVIVMQLYNIVMEVILSHIFIISFNKLAEMMRLNRFESVFRVRSVWQLQWLTQLWLGNHTQKVDGSNPFCFLCCLAQLVREPFDSYWGLKILSYECWSLKSIVVVQQSKEINRNNVAVKIFSMCLIFQ